MVLGNQWLLDTLVLQSNLENIHRHLNSLDFNKLLDLNELRDFAKNGPFVKPVVILSVDNGPDENPRY